MRYKILDNTESRYIIVNDISREEEMRIAIRKLYRIDTRTFTFKSFKDYRNNFTEKPESGFVTYNYLYPIWIIPLESGGRGEIK